MLQCASNYANIIVFLVNVHHVLYEENLLCSKSTLLSTHFTNLFCSNSWKRCLFWNSKFCYDFYDSCVFECLVLDGMNLKVGLAIWRILSWPHMRMWCICEKFKTVRDLFVWNTKSESKCLEILHELGTIRWLAWIDYDFSIQSVCVAMALCWNGKIHQLHSCARKLYDLFVLNRHW